MLRFNTTAFAGLAIAGLAASANAQVMNVLANPGFEDDDASMGDVADISGWEEFEGTFVSAALSNSGNNSMKAFGPVAGVFQDFAATEGQLWIGSAFAANPSFDPMGDDQVAAITVGSLDAAGNQFGVADFRIIDGGTNQPANDEYQYGQIDYLVPAGAVGVRFTLITGAFNDVDMDGTVEGGGAPFFDDARFGMLVPEPAGLSLLGLGALALVRRRR